MAKQIDSPCIGVCQLKSDVCTGCGRSSDEIARWRGMKRKDKMLVLQRARGRLKKIDPPRE